MKIVGIIVEYNPLHNGHVYHFNEIKKRSKADIVVAIISSSFTMRGEISVFNKFDKTTLALKMGVDIVIELPFVYAVSNANIFSYYSVKFLSMIKVSEIWIGSEFDNVKIYEDYLKAMESEKYNCLVKESIKNGVSYKKATTDAFAALGLKPILSNDILGLFYLKAIRNINPKITLNTIKRLGNNYLDSNITSNFASAKALRISGTNIFDYVPNYTYNLYKEKGFLEIDKIFDYLKFQVLNNPLKDSVTENDGFINKYKDIYKYNNYNDFIESLQTKRYTKSFINRTTLFVLFNLSSANIQSARENPNYVRVLGFNKTGREYIGQIKKDVRIITNIKDGIHKSLDIELKISKILDLIYNQNLFLHEQKGPKISI